MPPPAIILLFGLQDCKENGCCRFVVGGATGVLGSALDAWTRFENYAVNLMMYGTWRGCFVLVSGGRGRSRKILDESSTREAAKIFGFQPLSHCCQSAHARSNCHRRVPLYCGFRFHLPNGIEMNTEHFFCLNTVTVFRVPFVPCIVLRDSEGGGTACA